VFSSYRRFCGLTALRVRDDSGSGRGPPRPLTCLASLGENHENLAVSKRAVEHLSADPAMAALIERVGPVQLHPRRLSPFQSLAHAVIHQQLSGQAAGTILGRFRALFGPDGFPAPEAVLKASPDRLRSAGLSRPKARYVLGIAQHAVDGHLPTLEECERLTDEELVSRLTAIKGVGRWTVEMLLIFNLGRPDVLPVHDLGVRKGFRHAYGKRKLPKPEQLARYGLRWKPYRTAAAWYLWRAADFLDGDKW
jgi:DNA-3-methyladenine glycosylase II